MSRFNIVLIIIVFGFSSVVYAVTGYRFADAQSLASDKSSDYYHGSCSLITENVSDGNEFYLFQCGDKKVTVTCETRTGRCY